MGASRRGFSARLAEEAALARGYAAIVGPSYRSQRGDAAAAQLERALDRLEQAAAAGTTAPVQAAVDDVDRLLEGFRAAPLPPAEQARRAGQLDRFLRLVPIEYDRGVEGTRVTLAFEIQEAISFRNAVAVALADISPELLARDAAATRELTTIVDDLGRTLDAAGAGRATPAETVRARTDRALELVDDLYPDSWKEAASGADFDVIAASLDRLAAAAKAGSWGRAEQARLEAYGIFELGPEQRLRGIAPSLFQRIEGLFWYGDGGQAGLVQLVKRKDAGAELEESVAALQAELEQAAQRVGSSSSTAAVISNSAIVVFREGLEAVLILAALMASMVGPARRYRRPLLVGAGFALVASADHVGDRADRARLACALRREARGDRLGDRDRRAAADPELVLPPGVLGRASRRLPQAQAADPARLARRLHLGAGARACGAGLLERVPGRVRDAFSSCRR